LPSTQDYKQLRNFGSLPKALGIWRGQNNKSKKLENKIYFCLK